MKKVLGFLLLAAISCAPKMETRKASEPAREEFGPTIEDILVSLNPEGSYENLMGLTSGKFLASNSSDIFRFSEELNKFAAGHEKENDITKFSAHLLNLFYSDPNNSTSFTVENSSYLEAALAYEGENILKYFNNLASDETINNVQKIVNKELVEWPSANPNLEPSTFVTSIKKYLEVLKVRLDEGGINKNIVDGYWSSIQKNYLESLNNAEKNLVRVGPQSTLKYNIITIKNVIGGLEFLPIELRSDVKNQLKEAEVLQQLIDRPNASKANDMVQVIARIWLKLDDKGRELYIKPTNLDLYNEFKDSSIERLNLYAGLVDACKGGSKPPAGLICYEPSMIDKVHLSGVQTAFKESCYPDIQKAYEEWIGLNEYGRINNFRKKYPEIYKLFTQTYNSVNLSDEVILDNIENLTSFDFFKDDSFSQFENAVQNICVGKLKTVISNAINGFVLTSLDNTIRKQDHNLQNIVLKTITDNLYAIRKMTASVDQFMDTFSKAAHPELKRIMFSNISSLPGLERTNVGLYLDANNRLATKVLYNEARDYNKFYTGAEVLGTSMSAAYYRFLNMKNAENKSPESTEYGQVVFAQINKMLSMIGFRKLNNKMFPSLHKAISGPYEEFDVFKYDCNEDKTLKQLKLTLDHKIDPTPDNTLTRFELCRGYEEYSKSFFGIPDRIEIQEAFLPVGKSNIISVRGQAEILKGSSLMMGYFKDWKKEPDDYDAGLGKIEYKGFRVLPRTAFVNLSLGIYSVPLRNLKRDQTQVRIFDQWGNEISDWAKREDPNRWKVSAALTDVMTNGSSKIVRSADLARFLIAIDEFITSTEGIEKSQATVISPPGKTKKENLQALLDGKKQLLQMMVGISNFLMSRFQDSDGGFWHAYSLESETLTGKDSPRTLEDQVLIQDALLRTYYRWQGEGAKWAAIDALYFMNHKLWNSKTGFYRSSEAADAKQLKPHVFLQALNSLKSLDPFIKDSTSREQTKEIYRFWSEKYVKWILEYQNN